MPNSPKPPREEGAMTTVVPALSRRKTRAESDLEAAFGEIGGDLAGDFTARATV